MKKFKKLISKNPIFTENKDREEENKLKQNMKTKYEKIPTFVFDESSEASLRIAKDIATKIKKCQQENRPCVLGLPIGSTPKQVYNELIRIHKEEGLSFKNVITFNLDEYYPMKKDSIHSAYNYMQKNLFQYIDISPENIHIPNAELPIDKIYQYCQNYENLIKETGGIDILLLGIGRTGHIGFNEPGSQPNSGSRMIVVDTKTKQDAAPDFGGLEKVPMRAITIGIDTIMKAKKVILIAFGETKSHIIKNTVEKPISDQVPASFLQLHKNAKIYIDKAAAMELTRIETPWLVDTCDWKSDSLARKAVIWLCNITGKSILKLTHNDYINNGLSDLIAETGSAYDLNIRIFNELQHTITGWPGGKPNADDTYRPERKSPDRKRIIVFSPHPDDDVISMGGTLNRLVKQNHDVHVAYEVSGSIAVSNEYACRFISFYNSYSKSFDPDNKKNKEQYKKISSLLNQTKEEEKENPEVLKLKELIRKMEAKAASHFSDMKDDHIHFLRLPFYETGEIQKKPIGREDIDIVKNFIQEIKPHQIFAAGDLSDPHGTHRVCLNAILYALEELKNEEWMKNCWLWLYRGAWREWNIDQIEMAVPLSPEELYHKREAIFKHQSQKEGAMYLGDDSREFWQRAEDRNHNTAIQYNKLGMAEYEAMEAFVRYYP